MLEEGNETGCYGDKLFRRNIHVLNFLGLDLNEIRTVTRRYGFAKKLAAAVHRRVGLSNIEVFITITREIFDVISNAPTFYLAVRSFDESEVIDSGIGTQ